MTRAHALSELAGPQEIIYVRCLSESVLGYQLAVPPLAAVGGAAGEGSPLIYRRTIFASRILLYFYSIPCPLSSQMKLRPDSHLVSSY